MPFAWQPPLIHLRKFLTASPTGKRILVGTGSHHSRCSVLSKQIVIPRDTVRLTHSPVR